MKKSARPAATPLDCIGLIVLLAVVQPAFPADPSSGEYGTELAQVYGTYQAILARKEVCEQAAPTMKSANEQAYAAWRKRHAKLIAELDDRFAKMIRGASKDEKDYARNVGKYEGAVLQQRQEVKEALLAQPREELNELCKTMPNLLKSGDSDLEKIYAEELADIRKRP
jgi:hypothetical protein